MEKVLEMDSPGPAVVLIGTSPLSLLTPYQLYFKKTASGITMGKKYTTTLQNIDYSLKYMQSLCLARVGGEWEL